MYWCCAQVEQARDRLASHCLTLAGYKIYQPLLREQRRSHGRKIIATPALFPGYLFVWVVRGWWDARWSAGVRRLVMDGEVPARVPDAVIAEIKSRERNVPAVADVAEIAAVFDCRRVSELAGPEFLFDVPVRTTVSRRIAEGALQRCHRTIEGALTPARDACEGVLGGRAKSGAISR
jgi:transcription antitermination factor NusG